MAGWRRPGFETLAQDPRAALRLAAANVDDRAEIDRLTDAIQEATSPYSPMDFAACRAAWHVFE